MADKQIIIDGVDVSGCCQYMPRYMEDYDIDTLDYCRYHFKPCKDVDVKYCYYKQLKRKEQECEELKKEINGYKTIIGKIRQEVQEDVTCESRECGCDSYEECIECLKNTILNIIDEERNDFVQGRVICKECGKYKKALEDIEIYVRDNSDFDKSYKLTSNTSAYDILEIINEVKE